MVTHAHSAAQRRDIGHATPATPQYELRFTELFNAGRSFVFPCDANGNVDIDSLTERARANYFYARTTIGRHFCSPVTCGVTATA
jgi:hypothetical protein